LRYIWQSWCFSVGSTGGTTTRPGLSSAKRNIGKSRLPNEDDPNIPSCRVNFAQRSGSKGARLIRLLHQTTDPSTAESLKSYIEELERRLLIEMSEGPSE
jgi:hypothetical protein